METAKFFKNDQDQFISIDAMQQMLGQTIGVTKTNAESVAVMFEELKHVKNVVGGLTTRINGITDTITDYGDRINDLEYSVELTTTQVSILVEKSRGRVYDFLNEGTEDEKYYRIFILDLYRFLKRYGKASKIERTEKRFYESIVRGIGEWIPDIEKLKAKKDNQKKH